MFIKLFKKNQSKLFCFVCFVIIILLIICLRKSNRIDTFYVGPKGTGRELNADNYNDDKKFHLERGIRNYSSVTHIPDNAFKNIEDTSQINIEGDFPNLISIGKNAFYKFKGKITLRNLNVLTTIGQYAFYNVSNTDSVVEIPEIPGVGNQLESIGANAFRFFNGTITLNKLNKLVSIGHHAFTNATHTSSEVSITDGNQLESIDHHAFDQFKGTITLKNLNNLKTIGYIAFQGASNTKNEVEIPSTNVLQSIGISAFYQFKGKITLRNLNALTTIGNNAFSTTTNTKNEVEITGEKNILKDIGDYAFWLFKGTITLKNLNNLEYIGVGAFYEATNPNNVFDKCIPKMDAQDISRGLGGGGSGGGQLTEGYEYQGQTLECPVPTTSNRPTTTPNRPNRPNNNSGIDSNTQSCDAMFCAQTNSDCNRTCWQKILFHDLEPINMVGSNNYFFIKHITDSKYLYYNSIYDFGYDHIDKNNKKFKFKIANNSDSNGYVIYPYDDDDSVYLTLSEGKITFDSKRTGDKKYTQIFGNTP